MSYSHAADGKLAPALQRGIQRLGKPWYRRPVVRVFRDETSLAADPGLWSGIRRSLEQSEYLLLLSSVRSAASTWVQKEVAWWLEHRSMASLLIVVTDGEIVWKPAAADFDWEKTTCLPTLLRGRFRGEPHYADLRWARDGKNLSLRKAEFRTAVLTLAAPLHGQPMDELDSEDIRQQRSLRVSAGVAIVLMGLLTISTIVEFGNSQEESGKAESRSMAAKSVEFTESKRNIDKAIVLAVLAWRLSHTDEARMALEKLGTASAEVSAILGQHTGEIGTVVFSPAADQGPLLATGGNDGLIMLWHIPDGTPTGPPIASDQARIDEIQFSDDGAVLLSRGPSRRTEGESSPIVLHDLRSKTTKQVPIDVMFGERPEHELSKMSLSPNGQLVALASSRNIVVWDAATGKVRQKTLPFYDEIVYLRFTTDSRLLWVFSSTAIGEVGATLGLWDLETDRTQAGPRAGSYGFSDVVNAVALISKDGSKILTWGIGPPSLYTSGRDMSLDPLTFPVKGGSSVSFDGGGKRIAVTWEDKTVVWGLAEQKVLKEVDMSHFASSITLSPDGRWLAAVNGNVAIWDLSQQNAEAPAKALDAACSLTGGNEIECIRRLCEKVSPLITDKVLSDVVGAFAYDRLRQSRWKQIPWKDACAAP